MAMRGFPGKVLEEGSIVASRYVLERLLGQGGMGTVWIARSISLELRVALKLVRPEWEAPGAAVRLLSEARAEAKLEHPAIVRVFDLGETDDGAPFIVMELLDGRSLGEMLRENVRLAPAVAVRLLLPVLDALAYAHERGVVHRDLTPENIFLAREPHRVQPKIVDFGLAILAERPLRKVTENGTVVGSPRYMSPEQAMGEDDIDRRSDLWTTCVVLYEMVTGCPPFEGANYNATLRAVIDEDALPLREFGVGDDPLWRIIERGLSKARSGRWDSARDLGRALAAWLRDQGETSDICGESLEEHWLAVADVDETRDVLEDLVLPRSRTSVSPRLPAGRGDEPLLLPILRLGARLRRIPPVALSALAIAGTLLAFVVGFGGSGQESHADEPGGSAEPSARPAVAIAPPVELADLPLAESDEPPSDLEPPAPSPQPTARAAARAPESRGRPAKPRAPASGGDWLELKYPY